MASPCTTRTGSGGMFSRPSVVGTLALSVMSEAGGAGARSVPGALAIRSIGTNADGARSRPGAGPAFVPQLLKLALGRKTSGGHRSRATCTKQSMTDRKQAIQIVDGDEDVTVETNPSSGAQLVTYGAFSPMTVDCN